MLASITHLFTGCVWNSSFIQAEAGTIPQGVARGEMCMWRVELKSYFTQNQWIMFYYTDVYTLNKYLL